MPKNALCTLAANSCGEEERGCPLCNGLALETLSEHNGKQLRKCVDCGASFVLPQPEPSAIAAHFEDFQTLCEADLDTKFERNREPVLARVAECIQKRKSEGCILDVGCATGFFLARFFPKTNWQVWGIELSRQAAGKATRQGIRVHQGDIYEANFPDGFFDVVSVIDTFYYFLKPQLELAEFRRVLKPDGMLVLELPLGASRVWRTSNQLGKLLSGVQRHLIESSDHLFYYNPKSIKVFLERYGFSVQTILPLPGNRQEHFVRNLIYRVYSFVSLGLHSVSRANLFLGPRFLVVAHKS